MPQRTFTAVPPPAADPITFDLSWHGTSGNPVTKTFHCVPDMPFSMLLDVGRAVSKDDNIRASAAMLDFVEKAIVPEQLEEFRQAITAIVDGAVVGQETFRALFQWLLEVYGEEFPTQPSSVSPSTPLPTGVTTHPDWNGTAVPQPMAVTQIPGVSAGYFPTSMPSSSTT
ncbi:hypothetical protein [Frankia sp. Cj3]|uniref:hypothetical protein n=1 Tax=Frankia sp. Cj3 TaxID=2880976 RepID=UPI001EF443DC|nr:hypothetical protein [Frankia sp. Cj3]